MIKLGLDFGTTNSSISVYNEDGDLVRETFSMVDGERRPIPSLMAVRMDQWRNGIEALNAGIDNNGPFSVIKHLKPMLGIHETIRIDDRTHNVSEVTKRYFRHLLDHAGVGERVPFDIVIGTPIRYPREHRVTLARILREIGAHSVMFVYEPTAGLHYAISKDPEYTSGPVLVVDWGGGTVDVTISTADRSERTITDHDVSARKDGLGGSDLDLRLLDMLRKDQMVSDWYDQLGRSKQTRLMLAIESAKIRLLERGAPLDLKLDLPAAESIRERLVLSRNAVEDAALAMVEEVIGLCRQALSDAKLHTEDLAGCLLIGGLFQSAIMREIFQEQLKGVKSLTIDNRQLSTSRGCGLLAVQGYTLALAETLGVDEADGYFNPLIKQGHVFPVTEGLSPPVRFDFEVCDISSAVAQFVFFSNVKNGRAPRKRVGELTASVVSRQTSRQAMVGKIGSDSWYYDADVALWVGLDDKLYLKVEACGIRKQPTKEGHSFQELPHSVGYLDQIPMVVAYGSGQGAIE